MKKLIATLFLTITLLSGCIIIINQPSAEEKELYNLQQQMKKQVSDLQTTISSSNYDPATVESYIDSGLQAIQDGIKKVDEMKIPDKIKTIAEETKKKLQDLQRNYEQLKTLFNDIDSLKKKGAELTAEAKAEIDKQIKNLQGTVKEVLNLLNRSANYFQNLGQQIMGQYGSQQTTQQK